MPDIQQLLKGRNFSQVARVAGISRQTVSDIANGKSKNQKFVEYALEALELIDRDPTRGARKIGKPVGNGTMCVLWNNSRETR